jgi:Ser/Thr protein kinase RdoA (MazF antagonist)
MHVTEICEVFGLGTPKGPPSYVARGELGRVSRLATTTGSWAIKEIQLFLPTIDEADTNVDFQELMLAAGVDLPRPRRTVDGHALFQNVRVYEWLDLTPIPTADTNEDERVAATLARMHLHAPPTDHKPDPWYCQPTTRDEWNALLEDGAGTWWTTVITELLPELADAAPPEHSPAQICHLDVCPENVFLSNGRLTIIDWENAGPAATIQDLGSTLWDFCHGDIERTRAFADHYRRHNGPLDQLEVSAFDMARVVQANLIAFHCRHILDPSATPETRNRAEDALRSSLARPLTKKLIDDLLTAPSQ